MTTADDIRVGLVGVLAWTDQLVPVVADPGPPAGSGAIEIPGRRRMAVRTTLDIATGPAGIVARVIDPHGAPRPVVVRFSEGTGKVVEIDHAPSAVAPCRAGCWSLRGEELSLLGVDGTVRLRVGVAGVRLLAGPDDGVWVLGADRCRFVTTSGLVTELASPWRDADDVCVDDDVLTGWDPDRPGWILSVDRSGVQTVRALGVERRSFERPVAFGQRDVVTAMLRTLVHRGPGGDRSLTMTGAGLTGDGAAFLSGRTDGRSWLWREGSPALELTVGDDEQVAVVDGERTLTWSGERAAWWDVPTIHAEPAEIATPGTIVERGWAVVAPYPYAAAADGEVRIAASGPSGVAVIGLRWPP